MEKISNIQNPNFAALVQVAKALGVLRGSVVFVGGTVVGLLMTDPAAPEIRVTQDVDVIVEITTRKQYYDFSDQLKEKGFVEDANSSVICRWRLGSLVVDVMPTESDILGFSNRWYVPAIRHSVTKEITPDLTVRLITAPYFLATKFEAFESRGEKDFVSSPDIEDIIAVIDGRKELLSELSEAEKDVRTFLSERCSQLLKTRVFVEHVSGFLLGDLASQQRIPILLSRIRQIAAMKE
jgi:predicted nucleotidyltransferase